MLQLVLGIAGTGKTTWVLEELKKRAAQEKISLYLVPEQFSSSAETMVYRALGDAGSAYVEVVSFRTLAERILREYGGITEKIITDAGRAVYVRRALDTLEGRLTAFARSRRDTAFCNLCAHTLAELKTAGATPEQLHIIAGKVQDPKLSDLALVFAAYEEAIHGAAMDPEDRLTASAHRAGEGYFQDKACFIDNFDGFTPPEYGLLEPMLAHCEAVTVALCCDGLEETDGGLGRFSPVRATAQRLIRMAQRLSQRVKAPLHMQRQYRAGAPGLGALNHLLAYGSLEEEAADSAGVWLGQAPDTAAEVKQAAAEMRRLALTGVPYSRMALVCRDISQYEAVVRREFSLFGIPFFVDASDTIEYTSPVAFLRAALAFLQQGMVSAPVLALAKSGLSGCGEAEVAALDNYVYTWQPKAADWRKPFENNPAGLLVEMDDEGRRQLALAEGLRSRLVAPLEAFGTDAKGKGVRGLSRQLYLLLDRFDAARHSEERAAALEAAGDFEGGERARRAWDLAMDLLDQMALLLGDERLSAREYDELFLLLVRSTEFGQVPQSLECVTFTSADRMRLADPDYCFVVGIAEGEFPMQVGYSGLLTHADRDTLVENGIEMPGRFENRVLLEEMFFYRALTAPRKGLYLSWPARRGTAPLAMSAALEPVCLALAPPPPDVAPAALAATPRAAYDQLGAAYRDNTPGTAGLYAALEQSGEAWAPAALSLLREVDNPADFVVRDHGALRRLTGETLTISPTRADQYYSCRFSYFMERVLRVRPRRRAELSPLESGSFVHAILEAVLREARDGLAFLDDDALLEMTNRHADAFLAQHLPELTRRASHMLGRVKDATASLLCYIRDWARESDFSIDALELPIGGEGGIAPLAIEGEDGRRLVVTGKIDRVDVLRRGDKTYLCVIDYKTGSRKFDLNDVFYGRNIQMLLYMDVLMKNAQERYPGALPAGMLYLSSDPAPQSGIRRSGEAPPYHLDGLLLDDADIVEAMDHQCSGLFLPVKRNKNGTLRAGKHLQDLESIGALGSYIEGLLADMASGIGKGDFPARPLVKSNVRPCDYCAYRAACRHENGRGEVAMQKQPDDFASPKPEEEA